MTTIDTVSSARKRGFLQFWLPWLLIGVAMLAVTGLGFWPGERPTLAERVLFVTWVILPLLVLLLMAWAVFFSGWRWQMRLAAVLLPVALAGAAAAFLKHERFSSIMIPEFSFRWGRSHDDVVEEHRRSSSTDTGWKPGDLSGKRLTDFPEYRGRLRDGVVSNAGLTRDWQAHPPRLLWRQPVGGGYAGIVVADNAAITLEQRRDQEAIVCYDVATGKEVWAYSYPTLFEEKMGGLGPRATPTIADGEIYSLGAEGMLVCLDAGTGKVKWSVNVLEDNENLQWGMSGSPLVYDQVVVVNPGAQHPEAKGRALVAYDRATGRKVWSSGSTKAGYSSPMLATLGGLRQILLFDGEGLGGYDSDTGEELWRHDWPTHRDINVAQPVVLDGDRVFITSAYGVGCAMLRIVQESGKWQAKELWKNHAMHCKFTSPVAHQGNLYGLDDEVMVCVNVETGKRAWRADRQGLFKHAQLLLVDGVLLIVTEASELVLVEPTPEAYRELGRVPVLEGKTWNYHALASGKAFVRNHREMACYDLTGR